MNELKNKNELEIAKAILNNSSTLNNIDIKTLAQLSNNSASSITRFIKNFPVKSYKDFTHCYTNDFKKLNFAKKMHKEMLDHNTINEIIEKKYYEAQDNISSSFHNVDMEQLSEVISIIFQAKSVTIIGANHSLEIFSRLQIALITYKIPAFIFKQKNKLEIHLNTLTKDDLIIFVSVEGRYQKTLGDKILNLAKMKSLKSIIFTQSKRLDLSKFDKIIYYGNDLDVNIGYFSLVFMVDILIEMLKYKIV